MVNQCTLSLLQENGMTLLPSQSWLWVDWSSVRDEADLNTVVVILRVIKLTVAVRFGNNYAS